MNEYILSLDQGTTSSRAIIFDKNGIPVSVAQREFRQIFPEPGWVEHDPSEIWETQYSVALQAMDKISVGADAIAAAGITNQRETTIVWNRKTGKPVYNAIVWQDRRTAKYCDDLKGRGMEDTIRSKTGLVIDAYFSATKLKWILDNVEGARKSAEAGELAFGTVDTWLAWNLTDGHLHITDVTNASRTMLFNIHTLAWDDELLKLFDIPPSLLPEVKSSSELYGKILARKLENIPLAGIAGDQQAALFGQMCVEPGMVKNTYGTGCFMIMNTGEKPIKSESKLLTTIGWKIGEKTTYALEGSIFIAGAVVQWLRDGLGIIKNSAEIEMLAASATDNGGVFFVPAFAGLGAPYWNQHARGAMFGLTRGTSASQIARASLESIAYQTFDVLRAMETDSGIRIKQLRVDGGATVNNFLMQFQSDVMSTEVVRPVITETTALGAAYLAGLAVKYWTSTKQISRQWKIDRLFSPSMDENSRNGLLEGWSRAVRATEFWAGN